LSDSLISVWKTEQHLQESYEEKTHRKDEKVNGKSIEQFFFSETRHKKCGKGYCEQEEQNVCAVYEIPHQLYCGILPWKIIERQTEKASKEPKLRKRPRVYQKHENRDYQNPFNISFFLHHFT